ncbi:MAG: DNA double-strand break repair nuclease NurA, partial [Cyanobacteria bacterium J06649_4]
MAISPSQIQAVLNSKRVDFSSFQASASSYLSQYQAAWSEWVALSDQQRSRWLNSQQQSGSKQGATQGDSGLSSVGALPLEAFDLAKNGIIPSGLSWDNRQQSLEWVDQQLRNVTTFAVDGSQVFPQKDFSIPIALVQIGWFENHHCTEGTYEKDILLDVMTPKDLVAD